MMPAPDTETFETIVVGAGQAGLSVGYHLAKQGRDFVILDACDAVGDSWRSRWDSLRLFTPARFDGLDGMPFPGPGDRFPTKDEMGSYLQDYATRFELPVRTRSRVEQLSAGGDGYRLTAGGRRYAARNVVVAMANFQEPLVPDFAAELDPSIASLHSSQYRCADQLWPGDVLIVGAGNSGAEIGLELAGTHRVMIAGRDTGHVPFPIDGRMSQAVLSRLLLRFVFHRVLTVSTPMGRRVRPKLLGKGGPLIRVKPRNLSAAGVERLPRVTGVCDGQPMLADGRTVPVRNIIWCTGFRPGFSWIDVPVLDGDQPRHASGIVAEAPGLYFVGLHFLHAMSSAMIHGVGRDAQRVAAAIAARAAGRSRTGIVGTTGPRLSTSTSG